MINLIEHVNGLEFENIYVYYKSLYKPKYIYLEKVLKPIKVSTSKFDKWGEEESAESRRKICLNKQVKWGEHQLLGLVKTVG